MYYDVICPIFRLNFADPVRCEERAHPSNRRTTQPQAHFHRNPLGRTRTRRMPREFLGAEGESFDLWMILFKLL